jgi:hypothetical protein
MKKERFKFHQMLSLRKLLKLPSPKELGISESNALPMRDFTPWEKGACWEDYYDLLKKKYPIRYFISETAPDFFRNKIYYPFISPIVDCYDWLRYHLIPKRRYHFLDLRQPCGNDDIKNIDCYKYGWCDVPEKMLYAMFNLLKEYFDENPFDLRTRYTDEEINADPGLKTQQEYYDEAKAILYWWQVQRKQDKLKMDQLLHKWSDCRSDDTSPNDSETKFHYLQLRHAELNFDEKTDEMIARLMKIRKGLWT